MSYAPIATARVITAGSGYARLAMVAGLFISGMGNMYKRIKSFEFVFRKVVALLFIGIGVYYVIAVWV